MKRVSPLVTVADNDVMHFQQDGKSILRRLTFATLFMRTRNKMQKNLIFRLIWFSGIAIIQDDFDISANWNLDKNK